MHLKDKETELGVNNSHIKQLRANKAIKILGAYLCPKLMQEIGYEGIKIKIRESTVWLNNTVM